MKIHIEKDYPLISKDLTKIEFRSFVWDKTKLKKGAGSDLDKVEKEDEEIVESADN